MRTNTLACVHRVFVLCGMQDIAVLGSQAVEVVRDALRCDNDVHLSALNMAQPSSCLYLEGVFYLDCRDANAMDISKPVRDFLASKHVMAPRQPHRGACEGVWGGWEDLSPAETGGVHVEGCKLISALGACGPGDSGICCSHQKGRALATTWSSNLCRINSGLDEVLGAA